MKITLTLLLSILLVVVNGSFVDYKNSCNSKARNKIYWSENKPLEWKYFKGKSKKNSKYAANTTIHFSYIF